MGVIIMGVIKEDTKRLYYGSYVAVTMAHM